MAPVTTPLAGAQRALEAARRRIADEIRSYPAPISGCDAQFNHLLDLRQRLARASAALTRETPVPTSREP